MYNDFVSSPSMSTTRKEESMMSKSVRLYKKTATREGFEMYQDLFLTWKYGNKTYTVRVRPCFRTDYKKLLSQAETSK